MGILHGLKQKLERGLETTSQKSKKMLDISRLTLRIRGKKEHESELYAKLGQSVYQRWEQTGGLEMTDRTRAVLYNIKEVREKIKELETQLTQCADPAGASERRPPSLPAGHTLVDAPPSPPQTGEEPEPSWESWEGQAIFLCPNCGEQVKETAETCPHCRQRIYG